MASRVTVFEYIKDLEDRNMIYGKKERPDSQSFMMYVNEDNKLVSVLIELEDFEKAFLNLLEKSNKKLDRRDYSADAKMLGIKMTDPAKWSDEEKKHYNSFWFRKHREIDDRAKKLNAKERKQTSKRSGSLTKVEQDIKRAIRDNPYYLILNPVILFYIIVDMMFFRSIIKWPDEISNKEILSQMYSITYKKVAEIQFELSRFLESIKLGPYNPVELLIDYRYTGFKPDFWSCVYFYREINMDSEIRQVVKLIIKLNEDIKDLKLFKSVDPDFIYGLVEDIAEFTNELNERKSLQEMLIGHEYKRPTTTKERG